MHLTCRRRFPDFLNESVKAHHRARLDETVGALREDPQTGYQLSYALFGSELPPAGSTVMSTAE